MYCIDQYNNINFKFTLYYKQKMGGKKKGGDAKKKGGDDDGDNPAEMNAVLASGVEELKMKLVLEQERKDKSLTVEKQIRDNEKDLKKELEAQKEETLKCVEEMTEGYKRMEKKLQHDIDILIGEVEG